LFELDLQLLHFLLHLEELLLLVGVASSEGGCLVLEIFEAVLVLDHGLHLLQGLLFVLLSNLLPNLEEYVEGLRLQLLPQLVILMLELPHLQILLV